MTTHNRYRFIGDALVLAYLLKRLIRYPFGGTSIVPFDIYGLAHLIANRRQAAPIRARLGARAQA
jgi:hypothetical protein